MIRSCDESVEQNDSRLCDHVKAEILAGRANVQSGTVIECNHCRRRWLVAYFSYREPSRERGNVIYTLIKRDSVYGCIPVAQFI